MDGVETESMAFEYTNENWRDQLTKVNDKTITYDKIGNPLNDGEWTYTWQNGRQLASMTNGEITASFIYNENGLRVQKTVNGVVTKYTLHGKNIVHMTQGSNELHFFYDAQNKPAIVVYNGVPYSYVKNLQGDIVAILDSNKNVVVSYVYDAWGRPISKTGSMAATLGMVQPFRYRGYVYDEETGVFYLRSRYYSSHKCRFISSDSVLVRITLIGTLNGFAYCANAPIYSIDSEGTNPTIPGDKGFASADEAALAASEIMLGICLYTRIELGTVIYRYYEDGICLYGYADISFGEPHGCDPFATYQHNRIKPNDVVAYAHVHPNLPSFSKQDKKLAEAFPCHAYVADCTTLTMQKYLCQKPIPDQRNLGHKESGIDPIPVTPVGFALRVCF